MGEIAHASGIGRTTLYRHFPDRDSLVAAIYDRVLSEARALSVLVLEEGSGDPVSTIQELCVALVALGDRYRFLSQHDAAIKKDPKLHSGRGEPLQEFLQAGQRAGLVTCAVSADWLFSALVALTMQASSPAFSDAPERDQMLRETVGRILRPVPQSRPARSPRRTDPGSR